MDLSELVSHTRNNVLRDTALPSLWSDAELTLYLNQAVKEFAIRTHEIVDDSTAAVTTFDTVAGQAVYDLHESIIIVNEAGLVEYNDSDEEISYTPLRDRTRGQLRRRFSSGRPCYYTAQVRTDSIRLDPTPDAVYTIEMIVARKPLANMANPTDEPEISEEYHLNLCDYAAYRALVSNQPEGANMAAADTFKGIWDLGVRDAKRAIALKRAGETPQARANWTGKRYRSHA